MKDKLQVPVFLMAAAFLMSGILSGWERIGWDLNVPELVAQHGTFMAAGFFGTLLMLEKCLAMPSRYYLLIPLANGCGVFFLLHGDPHTAVSILTLASAAMCGVAFEMKRMSGQNFYWLIFTGFFCLFSGNVFLLISGLFQASAVLWMSFLLCIIIGERLELTRFLPVTRGQKRWLWAAVIVTLVGVGPYHLFGNYLFGIGMAGIAAWLLKFDIAFRSVSQKGQPRYSAITMITGYLWLFVSAYYVIVADNYDHFDYDALLHSFFLGFAFSMIFAHVPIIFPALFRLKVKLYHPGWYVILFLMQVSLVTRIAGDHLHSIEIRRWGGLLNGITILLFFISVLVLVIAGIRKPAQVRTSR